MGESDKLFGALQRTLQKLTTGFEDHDNSVEGCAGFSAHKAYLFFYNQVPGTEKEHPMSDGGHY